MFKKSLSIGLLTVASLIGLLGTSFAEDRSSGLLGKDEFVFNAPETKADVAARNYVYDQEELAMIGTEGGGEIKPTAKTLEAARSHNYDQEKLANVGTEGGNWEFSFDDRSSHSNQAVADQRDAVCSSNC